MPGIGKRVLLLLSFLCMLCTPAFSRTFENMVGFQDDRDENEKHFHEMAEIGVKWVRTFVFWSDIEPVRENPPKYHWKKYDERFKRLTEMGLTPIAIIHGNPSWISTYPGGPFDKGDIRDYLRFVQALVERYNGDRKNDGPGSPRILYWEIYNEPDLTSLEYARRIHWGFWGSEPAKYAELLRSVYPVIKKTSPDARVVFGGIALDNWVYFNSKFFEDVLEAGGGQHFDIMNFHFYFPFRTVWNKFGPDIIGKTNYVRGLLSSHGLSKEIFCTEAGHWSEHESSPEFQAGYLVKLFVRGMAADLKSLVWYTLVDYDTKGTNPTRGILDTRLNKKPAYHALKALLGNLKGTVYRQPLQFGMDFKVDLDWRDRFNYILSSSSVIEGYTLYRLDQNRNVYALWSNSKDLRLNLVGDSIRVYDRSGKRKDLGRSNDNPLSIKVNSDPILVEKSM